MAIDTYINGTVDPAASGKRDGADHVHVWKRGTTTAGDITIAFDRTKIVSRTTLRSALLQGLRTLEGGNELTA